MTTVHYQFKQWFKTTNGKALGTPVMLPTVFYFDRDIDALNFLQTEIENMRLSEEEVQNWELVKVTTDLIPNAIAKFTPISTKG